jgi:phytoene dehydrogenase-like protein
LCYALRVHWLKLDKTCFQSIDGLYCVGDSCFPGQGVIAVAFSGVMCAHRVAADIGKLELSHSIAVNCLQIESI